MPKCKNYLLTTINIQKIITCPVMTEIFIGIQVDFLTTEKSKQKVHFQFLKWNFFGSSSRECVTD